MAISELAVRGAEIPKPALNHPWISASRRALPSPSLDRALACRGWLPRGGSHDFARCRHAVSIALEKQASAAASVITLVALTGYGSAEDRCAAIAAGFETRELPSVRWAGMVVW